jgi:hypothetical protein
MKLLYGHQMLADHILFELASQIIHHKIEKCPCFLASNNISYRWGC